jgi:TonB family protein
MRFRADTFVFLTVAAPCFAQTTGSLDHFRAGEEFLRQHDLQSAASEFQEALGGDRNPSWTAVWAHIDLGRTFDATGQRERAIREYESALGTHDDTMGALTTARRYMQTAAAIEDFAPIGNEQDAARSAEVLTRVEPEYPAEARLAGLEGDILIAVALDRSGSITGLQTENSLGLGLDESALAAVRRWTFTPTLLRGEPIENVAHVQVHFRLPQRPQGWHATKVEFTKPETAVRPVLIEAARGGKMSPELAEEASIDAAISRTPTAIVSMEIDAEGNIDKLQVKGSSLPEWGEDAVRTLSRWRFTAAIQGEKAIRTTCIVELAWSAL